jgi:integron integrase
MPEARGLYEVSREKMRTRHFSYRTEQAYLYWIRRYVNFHNRKHPREMGSRELEAFLTHLAVDEHVSASTQNQALQALLFLYRHVLEIDLPWLENVTRARCPKRLPVVLTVAEVRSVLAQLDGAAWLFANLLYGSGLRLMEALRLRVKDVVIERGELIVRDAKGGKDRVTVLPTSIVDPLRAHLAKLHIRFEQQRRAGEPGASLPVALARKFPNSSRQWGVAVRISCALSVPGRIHGPAYSSPLA